MGLSRKKERKKERERERQHIDLSVRFILLFLFVLVGDCMYRCNNNRCYSAEEEAKVKADVAAAHKVYEDTVAEYAANNMTLPANITEPKLFNDVDCSTNKKFFIEPNGHRLNLSDWKDDMYFEQTYVDVVAVAQAEQTHWEAAQRDAQATVAKCIENPMFADRCKEYTTDAIMENSKNASAAQVQHFLEWQQKVKQTDKQNTNIDAQLGLGYGNYHKMPGAAGAYRTGVVKEFKVVGMDRITDFIHRLSIINREILYYLGTGDTSWQTLRGKFDELKSLNQEAIASSKYSYGKEKDYFLLAFSLANIPITIINLLLHFVVRRQLNKYSL